MRLRIGMSFVWMWCLVAHSSGQTTFVGFECDTTLQQELLNVLDEELVRTIFPECHIEVFADAYYDRSVGELFLDTSNIGKTWSGFELYTDGVDFNCDSFTDVFASALSLCSGRHMSGIVALDEIPSGVYSLGRVLPMDFGEDAFFSLFQEGTVFGSQLADHGVNSTDSHFPIQLNYGSPPSRPINEQTDGFSPAQDVRMLYDFVTGEVQLMADGDFGVYGISLNDHAFISDQFTSIAPAGVISLATSDQVHEVSNLPIGTGFHSLGKILPAGHAIESLDTLIADAYFIAWGHSNATTENNLPLSISVVPEPATNLAFLALLLVAACRVTRHVQ